MNTIIFNKLGSAVLFEHHGALEWEQGGRPYGGVPDSRHSHPEVGIMDGAPLKDNLGLRHGRTGARQNGGKVRHKWQALQDMVWPLKQWPHKHRDNPYPTKTEKILLALGSQMTLVQVSNWFANARRQLKNTVRQPDLRCCGTSAESNPNDATEGEQNVPPQDVKSSRFDSEKYEFNLRMVEITFAWMQLLFLSTSLTFGEEQLTHVSRDALDLKTGSFPYRNHPLCHFPVSTLPAQMEPFSFVHSYFSANITAEYLQENCDYIIHVKDESIAALTGALGCHGCCVPTQDAQNAKEKSVLLRVLLQHRPDEEDPKFMLLSPPTAFSLLISPATMGRPGGTYEMTFDNV
ncbi:hypothetical protein EI555_021561 [Monodon monoceros]|uniref:Homeobox domain-containing protein n=1 Tax=Monodon monoceros TaxID=40151 RepID=A0A4V5P6N2_MONMO|nr:hypothetical protein EI555_021561 [Monodon monoceros]